jgi:titin
MDGPWVLTVEDVDVGPIVREGVLNSWSIKLTEYVKTSGSKSPITVSGLTNGRQYSCTVAPVTKLGTAPLSNAATATPVPGAPSTPQIINTDYGNEEIYLTVSVSNNGGSAISTYTATCTDGTTQYTGTSSTSRITVSGLTNGVGYSCSVTATNAAGTSSSSATSPPIVPEYIPTGLPIWLLYEASK